METSPQERAEDLDGGGLELVHSEKSSEKHRCCDACREGRGSTFGYFSYEGSHYPPAWNKDEVLLLRNRWRAQAGDVFVVSHFPIMGILRVLVALVEGIDDPWLAGLVKKPHFCDMGASRRGANEYMNEISSWKGRRIFTTSALPSNFPCQFPFDHSDGQGPPPKVIVLLADPRNAFVIWWQFLFKNRCCSHQSGKIKGYTPSLVDFIELIARGELNVFGANYFDHAMMWAEVAERNPDMVQFFDVGRLGSLDPKEVRAELESVAGFLDIPTSRAAELAAATFKRPQDADASLQQDDCIFTQALNGGHLMELSGKNVYTFEDAVSEAAYDVHSTLRGLLKMWTNSSAVRLVQLAITSLQGIASAPPAFLTSPLKGDLVHAADQCRPCVFNIRGICRNTSDMCMYCHAPHSKVQRPSLKLRQRRRRAAQVLVRTPSRSPSPNSLKNLNSSSVIATNLVNALEA